MSARTLALLCLLPVTAPAQHTPNVAPEFAEWGELGPAPIVSGPYTGRVAAIACSTTDELRYYVGGADGGVWRTDDGGKWWVPLGDTLPTTAIGALAVDPNDDDVIYAGMGEGNFANHSRYGLGFARSRNAGQTWAVFGQDLFGGRCFSRIRVNPQDTSVLYAATTHAGGFPAKVAARGHPLRDGPLGVFKSTDHGSTWTQLANGLPTTLSATDLALDPQNPNVVYAAIGDIFGAPQNGIYRSTDAGASFSRLGGGLPTSGLGRLTIAIAPTDPNTIYVAAVYPGTSTGAGAGTRSVYKSTDAGTTWKAIPTPNYHAGFGWYLSTAAVDPADPDTLIVGGLSCHRTSDDGGTWSTITPPHVDLHALEFDATGRLLCGNDGGVHRSIDLGASWKAINANLGLIQFYAGISLDPADPNVIYGGTQDNGSVVRQGGENGWVSVLGGDGGYTGIDSSGTRVFVEFQGTGSLYRSVNGSRFSRVGWLITGRNCFLPPYEIHPTDPLRMIYGTELLWESQDGGSSWTPIGPDITGGGGAAISGLAWSPVDVQTIYALTNDGLVQVSRDGGKTWMLSRTGVATWPRVRRPFALHPEKPESAFLAVAGFGSERLLHTEDGGATWTSAAGNLPDIPVNSVAVRLIDDGVDSSSLILFVGTDQGVWRSDNDGQNWYRYGGNLPNAPVIDLRIDLPRLRIVAATQGRGVWQARLKPHREIPPK